MKSVFLAIQLFIAITLIGLILMQTSKGGLQTQMGGADFYRTKRGAEKIVFTLTMLAASLFFLMTIINVFLVK
ncbi:MAG: Protein-export membrane protein SecG [Microgenomates group bacterium GW2011_GWC1_43_11]|uniref:Protein-export membrane protein SecG n=2 Tax=Candidatus Gottesmaniibacteriota TaxID=1752720 RepID=A0A0G1INH8_9BACT|nr:MAG: Protein-export membrane protein SecG [Microgenomates group bacterium GW2011_GWC1_43_11]KKT37640.1 MAG: Protein-export membrane protein SecG [Candidatus Gottesmanbacteria bacterium GW2011_GWB1_44_11c]KKT60488.1 MAG: Protein-export membrane protein SecG [Candidatus Gottesmanbacteria bacterium GW2011_GWA1_44_24b]HCM82047.1 preprotein translocase subunit SecG [Patescibacteria group bacterium]